MAELQELVVKASNGSFRLDVVDGEARKLAQQALDAAGSGSGGDCNIQRIESLDETNLVNLRDLESGSYVLYGYFTPYSGAPETFTIDNCFSAVVHLNAGSHVMVYNPRNFKLECYEVLEDETAPDGFTYTREIVSMMELTGLVERIEGLEARGVKGIKELDLLAQNWQNITDGEWCQTFEFDFVTQNTDVEIRIDENAVKILENKTLTFDVANENGVVVIRAIGENMPTHDYTVQIVCEEVTWL